MTQADLDLEATGQMREHGHFEWACFAAQQAAEKAVKAATESEGTDARGPSVVGLLERLREVPEGLMEVGSGSTGTTSLPAAQTPTLGQRRPGN